MMNQIIEYMKQRSVSTLVVSYTVFWGIYHWQGIYTTLFTDQDYIMAKYGLLKNEYVQQYFFGFGRNDKLSWVLGLVVPAALALLYTLVLPFLIDWVYKYEVKHRVKRKIIRIQEERKISAEERKNAEEEVKIASAEVELSKKRAEKASVDPETRWGEQYKEFLGEDASKAFSILDELKAVIYVHNGYFETAYGERYLSEDSLMICDTNGLIGFDSTASRRIYLTDKGKYFLKQYSLENIK